MKRNILYNEYIAAIMQFITMQASIKLSLSLPD